MERSRAVVVAVLAVAATLAVVAAGAVWFLGREDTSTSGPTPGQTSAASPVSPTESPPASGSTSPQDVVIGGAPGAGFVTSPPDIDGDPVELEHFSSPTGNIGCFLTTERVQCELAEHDFELPPEPADCRLSWVAAVAVDTEPAPVRTVGSCQGDTALGADDQLAYGEVSVVGDFACLSQERGMTCWHQDTGHGFTLSRSAYALF